MGPRVHNRSIFDPKISIFLCYTHITPIFGGTSLDLKFLVGGPKSIYRAGTGSDFQWLRVTVTDSDRQ